MIYAIQGSLIHLSERSVVLEDLSGVSWEMEISLHTRQELATESGDHRRVYTYLYHREDQMSLYGFSQLAEKRLFLLLNRVNGIGPKQSIKILGAAQPAELASAIVNEDEGFLTALPGIGAKGAKKIILALKDLVGEFATTMSKSLPGAPTLGLLSENLIRVLVDMGFDKKAATVVISRILAETEGADEGELLRLAIIQLS